jgi:hypothetical protein
MTQRDAQRVEMARKVYDELPGSIAGSMVTDRDTYQLIPCRLLEALGEALYGDLTEGDES